MKAPPLKRRPFRQSKNIKHQCQPPTISLISWRPDTDCIPFTNPSSLEPGAPGARTWIIEGDDTLTGTVRNGNGDQQTYLPLLSAALRRINYESFLDFHQRVRMDWWPKSTIESVCLYATNYELSSGFRKRHLENSTRRCTYCIPSSYHRTSRKRWKLTTIWLLFPWVGWSQSRWENAERVTMGQLSRDCHGAKAGSKTESRWVCLLTKT